MGQFIFRAGEQAIQGVPIGRLNDLDKRVKTLESAGGSSPLTTKGDIYVYGATNTRLPVGTDGQVLSSDSTQATGLKWIASSGSPGGSNTQLQYNNSGGFGGISGATTDGTTVTLTTPVLSGLPTGSGVASAATASTLMSRNSNANTNINNIIQGYTTTATAAGTTTLTVSSTYLQFFTGTTTQTVQLPVTSTLTTGHQFYIRNNSTGLVTVTSSGGNTVRILASGTRCMVTCINTGVTDATGWSSNYLGAIGTDGKSLSYNNTLTLAGTDGTTLTFQGTDTYVGRATTDTLTNKRITARTDTVASSATPTINTDTTDIFTITALAANITSMTTNLSGTPTLGQRLLIRILDNGTARTITWGASFVSRGAALPTTTVISKYLYVSLIWNSTTSTWDCIGAVQET